MVLLGTSDQGLWDELSPAPGVAVISATGGLELEQAIGSIEAVGQFYAPPIDPMG